MLGVRRVWRYQRGNQKPYIEVEQTMQCPKEKVQKDKQQSTKHTYKAKDRVSRTPLKTGGELRFSGRVSSSCSTSGTRRVNLVSSYAPEKYYDFYRPIQLTSVVSWYHSRLMKVLFYIFSFCNLIPDVLDLFFASSEEQYQPYLVHKSVFLPWNLFLLLLLFLMVFLYSHWFSFPPASSSTPWGLCITVTTCTAIVFWNRTFRIL